MTFFDTIIVGSGPAGVSAAYQLRSPRTLLLDVGNIAASSSLPPGNIYDIRRESADLFEPLIGERFQALHNIERSYLSPKLKGPLMRFVTDAPEGAGVADSKEFDAVVSFARGGLANAWGAGVYRYTDRDLRGFPISSSELAPFYDALTRHIGIAGESDDLSSWFGSTTALMAPLPLNEISADLMKRYAKKRSLFHRRHIRMGRPRVAILSEDHEGRTKHDATNREFFEPNISSIYHPGYTLDRLVEEKLVIYRSGFLVFRYEENESGVQVFARNVATGEVATFEGRALLLGAGTLGTTRIVLTSHDDYESRLPLLDNMVSYVPLINFARIGLALDTHGVASGQINVLYDGPLHEQPLLAAFYGLAGPLRSDLVFELPLTIKGNLTAIKYLVPALAMLQLFYPDDASHGNFVQLQRDGRLSIHYHQRLGGAVERHLISAFRSIGYFSHSRLTKAMPPGSSMHYAGTLPMREHPVKRYETDRDGRLNGSRNVYAIDGSCFSSLPSKNHTFTIMANAMRIAAGFAR